MYWIVLQLVLQALLNCASSPSLLKAFVLVLKHLHKCFTLCLKHLCKCLPHVWVSTLYMYILHVHVKKIRLESMTLTIKHYKCVTPVQTKDAFTSYQEISLSLQLFLEVSSKYGNLTIVTCSLGCCSLFRYYLTILTQTFQSIKVKMLKEWSEFPTASLIEITICVQY